MATSAITLARLKDHIETLSTYGRNADGHGITRSCWSPAHEEARAWLLGRMKAAGLETRVDAAGNTFGMLPGEGAAVLTGSHIDTVPEGGPLDGALGVLAGLECLQTIKEAGLSVAAAARGGGVERRGGPLREPLRLARLHRPARPRPGRRPSGPLDGEPLVDAMARAGYDASRVAEARCDPRTLHAYIELHIEQGPHLDQARIPIGLVEGIVGIRRNRLTFIGEPDHAGTTPMARRKDAFLGACEYALKAREHIVRKGSGRSVTNFGRIELAPGRVQHRARPRGADAGDAGARRPDPGPARPRVRGPGPDGGAAARPAGGRRDALAHRPRALCAPRVMDAVQAACDALRLRYRRMPSGAGHDAQNLAAVTASGMLFIPSRGGRSHRPDEMSDWKAIGRGANALLQTLLRLAG